jgi:hypothetical protein
LRAVSHKLWRKRKRGGVVASLFVFGRTAGGGFITEGTEKINDGRRGRSGKN